MVFFGFACCNSIRKNATKLVMTRKVINKTNCLNFVILLLFLLILKLYSTTPETNNNNSNNKGVIIIKKRRIQKNHYDEDEVEAFDLHQPLPPLNEEAEWIIEPPQKTETIITNSSSSFFSVIEDTIPMQKNNNTDNENGEEEFNQMSKSPIFRHHCPLGWYSLSPSDHVCFHVSLIQTSVNNAFAQCDLLTAQHGLYLGEVTSVEKNENAISNLLCSILHRGSSKNGEPSRVIVRKSNTRVGLIKCAGDFKLGEKVDELIGNGNVEAFPFACTATRGATNNNKQDEKNNSGLDTIGNEIKSATSIVWTEIAPLPIAVKHCMKPLLQHHSVNQRLLPQQIQWKISPARARDEPMRYYAVWHSKSWFGWLDFWVDYLVKNKDFKVAPVGKNVVVSRSASGRTGYSGIFTNPNTAVKHQVKVVLSRLPIPANVLINFNNGTLVNQVYTDPLVRVPLGDKIELFRVVDSFAKRMLGKECTKSAQPHSYLSLEILPETYDAASVAGCEDLVQKMRGKELDAEGETMWVVKGPLHGGAQVSVMDSRQVMERLGACEKHVLDREELVQRLVSDTLILDGKKFDLRVFVLIASTNPLLVYVHKEPYFRASMKKLLGEDEEEESSAQAKSQWVTNTHVQKRNTTESKFTEKDWQNHLWTLDKVKTYAERAGIPSDFWERLVFPRIKRSVQIVMQASAHTLVDRRAGQFKLFGVDFVIDANLKPLLLDWNAFPGWDWSYRLSWTLKYRRKVLDDMWKLVLDVQRGAGIAETRVTANSGGFELVFNGE